MPRKKQQNIVRQEKKTNWRRLGLVCPFCGNTRYRAQISLFVPKHRIERKCRWHRCVFYNIPVDIAITTSHQATEEEPYFIDVVVWD
jgi:hypothetical protein